MRESIGGTALFYMFAVFLITLAVIIGITVNYMSAYRANNYIVSRIEQKNGNVGTNLAAELKKYGYNLKQDKVDFCCVDISGSSYMNGGAVARIYTYLNFRIPLLPINIPITVRGETRTIQGTTCKEVSANLNSAGLGSCPN